MGKYVIIRADDLGISEAVNLGIAKAVKMGPVRTVGVMVNMEAAAHGISLLSKKECCLGLHCNISLGRPLCRPEEVPSLADENGEFHSSRRYRSGDEPAACADLYREITAQYRMYLELVGKKPSYFETHAVAFKNLDLVMREIAKEHDLLYQPPFREMIVNKKLVRMCPLRAMEEGYDAKAAVRETLCSLEENGYYVYVCHPGYLDRYLWEHSSLRLPRMDEVEMLCDPELPEWLERQGIKCITYDDLTGK